MDIQPYLVPLIATLVTVAAGLVAIEVVHRPRPEADAEDAPAAPHTGLRVVALGFAGSGKTALLAAMAHTLSREDGHGVSVRADARSPDRHDHQDALNDLAAKFEDYNKALPFPNPHGEVRPYALAFHVAAGPARQHQQPLRFTYVDYSGDRLRDGHRSPGLAEPLRTALADADVVLGLLDGAHVAALMRSAADDSVLQDLRNLFRMLHEHEGTVIQLVVTKWDLLVAENRSLADVVDWLTDRISLMRDLRKANRDSPVRVIPTSAFGLNGFMAEVEPGRVRRDPNLTWQPHLAEVPIACGINDVLGSRIGRLAATVDGTDPAPFPENEVSPFFAWAVKLLGLVTVSTDIQGNIQLAFNPTALDRYRSMVTTGPGQPPPGADPDASAESYALQLVLRRCRALTDDLDHAFPAARPR